jgi:CIC family chloride channel protein
VAFNAPVGGILFVVEELRDKFSLTRESLLSVILASLTAVGIGWLIVGADRVLPIAAHQLASGREWLLVLPFAMLVGGYAAWFNWALVGTLDAVRLLRQRLSWPFVAALIGGSVGALLSLLIDATGGGEGLVPNLLTGRSGLPLLLLLLVVRSVAFNICYASGTPGGIFAPQLAFGTLLALLFCGAFEHLAPALITDPGRFAVVGMAALIAATVRAPLTGLALIIEMTGDFAQIPFALAGAAIASVTAHLLGSRPIYDVLLERTLRLAGEGPAAPPDRTGAVRS